MNITALFLNALNVLMSSQWLVALAAFSVLILLVVVARRGGGRSRDFPYVRREKLITAAERRFLTILDAACGSHYRVFAQVRVGDVLKVEPGHNASVSTSARNRINSKHIDFVLVDPATMQIACCIELDDRSHGHPARRERDAFLNAAFAAAGLPLLRVPCRKEYDARALRQAIQDAVAAH